MCVQRICNFFVTEPRWVLQQEGWAADLLDLDSPLVAGRKDQPGIRDASQVAQAGDG